MRVHGIKIHPWRVCERFCIWVVKYYACQPSFFFFLFFFFSPAALSGEPRQRIKSPASLSYICRSLTCAPSGCLGFLSGRQVCREYGPEATEPPPIQQNEIFHWILWSLVVSLHGFGLGTLSPDLQSRDGVGGEENIFPSFVSRLLLVHPCAWHQPYYWSIIKRVYRSRPAAGGGGDWQVSGQKEETTGESRV